MHNNARLCELRMMRQMIRQKIHPLNEDTSLVETKKSFWKQFFSDVCNNISFHGLNHFVDNDRSVMEKFFWASLVICAVFAAIFSIVEIWFTFTESTTETVVETIYFKNSEVAFPTVAICDASRVDWNKASKLGDLNIPEYSNSTKDAIHALLQALAIIEFGEFDEFEKIKPYSDVFPKLRTLRISELLLKVMRRCEELFVGKCWWRSHQIDCCLLFELQKTEFGFCYSFNSDVSENSKRLSVVKKGINSFWKDPDGVSRPRRSSSRGQWSGLRVAVSTPTAESVPCCIRRRTDLKILVGEPRTYIMGNEMTVAAGQFAHIHVWGDRIYSTERLRYMDPVKRQCLYSDETIALGLPYYFRQNCKTDCYKYHTYKYCNCSPDFMFFEANDNALKYPPCRVEDLLCLSKHNNVFNNMIPNFAHSFFDKNESGIFCECLPDCTHQMYISEATIGGESNSSTEVLLDIHFRQSTCILYRSDVAFSWLDLLVAFGGCTGLFLGGSLLSCVELIYFMTLRLYFQWRSWKE